MRGTNSSSRLCRPELSRWCRSNQESCFERATVGESSRRLLREPPRPLLLTLVYGRDIRGRNNGLVVMQRTGVTNFMQAQKGLRRSTSDEGSPKKSTTVRGQEIEIYFYNNQFF